MECRVHWFRRPCKSIIFQIPCKSVIGNSSIFMLNFFIDLLQLKTSTIILRSSWTLNVPFMGSMESQWIIFLGMCSYLQLYLGCQNTGNYWEPIELFTARVFLLLQITLKEHPYNVLMFHLKYFIYILRNLVLKFWCY